MYLVYRRVYSITLIGSMAENPEPENKLINKSIYKTGQGGTITWAQEIEAAVSHDGATALQPERQSKTLS